MISRMLHKTKGRFFIFLILLVVCISIVYIYLMYMQENFRSVQWSEKRCLSELTSVKSQLNVVTEYKNRIEKILSDTQKSQNADKDKFKDVMDSFKAMKQQSAICQSQFDDIQTECKKCRELYNQGNKEMLQLKGQYQELQKTHEKLQNTVKEQYIFIDTLRNENARLLDSLQAQAIPSRLEPGIRHYNNKSFVHQLAVNDDVYKIDFKINIKNDDKNKVSSKGSKEIHSDNDNQLVQPYKMNMENKVNKGGAIVVPNALPPGFAPILPVENVINSNLPKPIETDDRLKDHNKQDDPDLNKVDAFENNVNMHDIDINDGIKIDDKDLNMPDQNQNVEEDEDDGEEYPT